MTRKQHKDTRNHYVRHVADLEQQLNSKLEQLSVLERENKHLAHKENALRAAIYGLQGHVAVTADVLAAATTTAATSSQDAGTSAQHAEGNSQDSLSNKSHAESGSCSLDSNVQSRSSPSASRHNSSTGISTEGIAASVSYKDSPALLQRLDQQESQAQEVLQQLGCDAEAYQQLYSTQLLHRAVSEPGRVAAHLSMTKPERLDCIAEVVPRMALLLGKYDAAIGSLSTGSPREQLDQLVDELVERIVVCALWDPPSRYLSNLMINVQTKEFERYPEGWWQQVVQAVDLSAEQRAAVHLVWQRVKSSTTDLTQQYEQLQQQLQQVHVVQLQKNRQFEIDTKQVPGLQAVHSRAERAWQERKQQEQLQQQLQQQQQQEQASTPDAGGAHSPAHSAAKQAGSAVAGGADRGDSARNSSSGNFALTPGIHSSRLAEAEEVLLQSGPVERQLLERQMQACTDKIRVLHMCQALQLTNTMSRKQLAVMCVHAHPFVPDAISMCEALDALGWDA